MQFTYVSKLGAFKGTFNVYADPDGDGAFRKYKANVSGVTAWGEVWHPAPS